MRWSASTHSDRHSARGKGRALSGRGSSRGGGGGAHRRGGRPGGARAVRPPPAACSSEGPAQSPQCATAPGGARGADTQGKMGGRWERGGHGGSISGNQQQRLSPRQYQQRPPRACLVEPPRTSGSRRPSPVTRRAGRRRSITSSCSRGLPNVASKPSAVALHGQYRQGAITPGRAIAMRAAALAGRGEGATRSPACRPTAHGRTSSHLASRSRGWPLHPADPCQRP